MESDINKENQYLFTTSSYTTLTELYNLNTDNYEVKSSSDFAGNEIFSYQFQLLETIIENKNVYFLLYIYTNTNGEGNYITIKKFGFTSFSLNYESIDEITISNNYNNRIISTYIVEEKEIIALFFIKNNSRLVVSFYTLDLVEKGIEEQISAV